MTHLRRASVWTVLCTSGMVIVQLTHWSRDWFTATDGFAALLQGTLPNFGAAIVYSFFGLMVRWPERPQAEAAPPALVTRWFAGGATVSLVGLLGWEWLQRSGGLVFDPGDMVATVAGVAAAVLLYRRVR